jgi:putative endonuclease
MSSTGYTSRKKPWALVYYEFFENKAQALRREKFLKAQKNQSFYRSLIQAFRG